MSLFPILAEYFMYSHLPYFLYIALLLRRRGVDMTAPTTPTSTPTTPTSTPTTLTTAIPIHVFDGPITRSRAKKLQQEVHALLCEIHFTINESYILPKSCTLLMLRFTKKDDKNSQGNGHRRIMLEPSQSCRIVSKK
jgi:hypothetical protein